MTLKELVDEVDVVRAEGDLGVTISGLCYDSRHARRGEVFFALPGLRADGGSFARAAREAGAVAVVAARGAAVPADGSGAQIEVEDARRALAQAANRFYAHPSRGLQVVGVTGTNGKTTITWMLESIFRAAGREPGVIGTTGVRFKGAERAQRFTTPEAPDLQGVLREMADAGVQAVAIEVSSHALAQSRSYGLECDVAVFTNLSHDHLDYHGTMEAYLDAKLRLFDGRNGSSAKQRFAVVNADDPAAPRVLAACAAGGVQALQVGMEPPGSSRETPLRMLLGSVAATSSGLVVRYSVAFVPSARKESIGDGWRFRSAGEGPFQLPLLGRYNAVNALLAAGAALLLGIDPAEIVRGLESMPAVPGRLERVRAGQPFPVVVDYAHTPDALERALGAMREHFSHRVLLVFGCGGDRDRAKRPVMGGIAARAADIAWITNDNPRTEDPQAIAREILAGAVAPREPLRLVLDRRAAIDQAIAEARAGDVVLIAGKGHETTQTIGSSAQPVDDRVVAAECLKAAGWRP